MKKHNQIKQIQYAYQRNFIIELVHINDWITAVFFVFNSKYYLIIFTLFLKATALNTYILHIQ